MVKFHEYIQLRYDKTIARQLQALDVGPWDRLLDEFPGLAIRPLFNSVEPGKIQELAAEAARRDRTYKPPNFLTYFVVDCPATVDPHAVAKALRDWRTVEDAYYDPPGTDPVVNAANDPRWPNQGYLDPAPDGIDAEYAWGFAGGDGAGQQVIDLEQGWTLNHEDLTAHGAAVLFGTVQNGSRPHGTAVLGEICAVDNATGCVGIAPNVASVDVVSHSGNINNIANAILSAIANLPFGGVLLLEVQITFLPAETAQANFDTIRLATALGITVVEAAGNGGNDLDTFVNGGGLLVLNRASANFRDSGAVMVGAGSSAAPHTRLGFSNFGSRIDCYAWGENVDTSSSTTAVPFSTTAYTGTFNGTSSASPIITGAALVVQGIAEASLGYRFNAWDMRALLSNPATGTASNNPVADRIGVMPNLRTIIDGGVIAASPDLYLRDFVGDTGDPHAGPISASPDIILRPSQEANPQAAFGEGSGTENANSLGFEAEAGQDNYIYVRVRNRGGSDAANVTATIFWSPVATLVTPNLWTPVGTTAPAALVPMGQVLTVLPELVWPQGLVPGQGHYCFVGLVGSPADPAPAPADFLDWTNFQNFIRNNNNVTWRNFNVVDNNPDPKADPSGYVALEFLAPGAPDRARMMQLEVVARLPKGAAALLEMPLAMVDALRDVGEVKIDKRRKVALVPVNPHGIRTFSEMLFMSKSLAALRLLVRIPKENRDTPYEVFVRQLFEKQEVGRVTWRLSPKARRKPDNRRPPLRRATRRS